MQDEVAGLKLAINAGAAGIAAPDGPFSKKV
jgi:hypothetical protein